MGEEKLVLMKIKCIQCGLDFVFTIGEQRYFASKGLVQPRRCAACREIRRQNIADSKEGESA